MSRSTALPTRMFAKARFVFFCIAFSAHGQTPTLQQLYGSLNLTLSLPPASRSLGAGGNPKVDSALRTLLGSAPSRSLGSIQTSARGLGVPVRAGRVSVVATASSLANVASLQASIVRAGGEVVSTFDRAILARIPGNSIDALGNDPTLAYLAPQDEATLPDLPASTPSTRGLMSDGLQATKANLLHARGIKGAHIKIGIIDFGFTGYNALQSRGLLPAPKAVKAFGADNGWDRVDKGVVHGAACAEIIHAMAPEAELYIASVGDGSGSASWDEIVPAAQWLATQGIDIISYSGGSHGGAHNGNDLKDKLVEQVTAKGILWIASAGNEGDDHWSTTTKVNAAGEVLTGAKSFLLMRAFTNQMRVEVVWDDWGPDPLKPTASEDYDIALNKVDPATQRTVFATASAKTQNGAGRPYEAFNFECEKGALYALFIVGDHVTRPLKLHVFSSGVDLFPRSPEGSIGIPAANQKVLAVGAVNVDNASLEVYSSQGPTDDGRSKPDVSAPDRVLSQAYGKEFTGTSAACPFAAGFAALVMQLRGKLPPAQMVQIMLSATTPLGNNRGAGRGLIDASKLPGIGSSPGTGSPPAPQPAPQPAPAPPPVVSGLSATFESLFNLARADNPMGLRVVTGHPTYKAGDGMKLGYRSEREGYCMVVQRSAAGQFTVLQPVGPVELRVTANTPQVFPAEEGQAIRITGAPGEQRVGVICSAEKIGKDSIQRASPGSLSVNAVSFQTN